MLIHSNAGHGGASAIAARSTSLFSVITPRECERAIPVKAPLARNGCGEKGFDPHKQVQDRKRHLLTDTLGLMLFVAVCAVCIADSDGAKYIFHGTKARFPRLHTVLVDQGYKSWLVELVTKAHPLDRAHGHAFDVDQRFTGCHFMTLRECGAQYSTRAVSSQRAFGISLPICYLSVLAL